MEPASTHPCANCARMQARLDALQSQVDSLCGEVATLREQLAAAQDFRHLVEAAFRHSSFTLHHRGDKISHKRLLE